MKIISFGTKTPSKDGYYEHKIYLAISSCKVNLTDESFSRSSSGRDYV